MKTIATDDFIRGRTLVEFVQEPDDGIMLTEQLRELCKIANNLGMTGRRITRVAPRAETALGDSSAVRFDWEHEKPTQPFFAQGGFQIEYGPEAASETR